MENEEDNPPSYSDAMAAIADGMRRQGIQSRYELTPAEMSGQFSDVVVIFPPSRDSLSSGGSSFQIVDPSLPNEPPPPYTEDNSPPSSISTQIDPPRSPSLSLPDPNSANDQKHTYNSPSMPNYSTQTSKSHVFQVDRNRVPPSAPSAPGASWAPRDGSMASTDYGLAVRATVDSKPSKQEHKDDPSLPGRVIFEQTDFVITSSSPPSTDIKWNVPANANNFSGLLYTIEIQASSRPVVSGTSKYGFRPEPDWLEILDSSRPSVRVYHTPSSLIIGPAKWSLKDPLSLHNIKVRLRVRAVEGNNRLPSCLKGPWSEEVTVRYIDTSQITDSQEKAYDKNRKSRQLSKSEVTNTNQTPCAPLREIVNLEPITLKTREYYLSRDTTIQTYITWIMPANTGSFNVVWYEVQCFNKAPLALCSKGLGKAVVKLCESEALGHLDAWETIAEVQSASLRVQKLSTYLSVGQYKWDISNSDEAFSIELRIRPVGIRPNGVLKGPWSEIITVHFNKEKTKTKF